MRIPGGLELLRQEGHGVALELGHLRSGEHDACTEVAEEVVALAPEFLSRLQWNLHELSGKLTSDSISPQAEAELLATFRDWKGNGSA